MKRIRQYFRIPPQCDTRVVGNMVDTGFFKPPETPPAKTHFTYLIVAMLRPEKQIDRIIRTFISIGNTHLAKLRIVGDGPEYEHLAKTARDCSLSRQVEFVRETGRDVVLHNLQHADVCMLYSKMETFGVSLVEALSCGIPVIAGNIGGPNDYVHKNNGILVPVGDPMALADVMKKMISISGKYDAQAIRQEIVEKYDKEVITGKLRPSTAPCAADPPQSSSPNARTPNTNRIKNVFCLYFPSCRIYFPLREWIRNGCII
ncbi:MAG: glycosyltransferase [Candidatus Marinimicrobia bacterium]|nr:glycosyltransferase [Candidatus Neomarinimicrobiota bacterium]